MSVNFTISDLKKAMGPGLGLRKSKYLVHIPLDKDGKQINILCRSTSLPERSVDVQTLYHLGRKYTVRAETNFSEEYSISIIDDSKMSLRKMFDKWLNTVDDTTVNKSEPKIITGSGDTPKLTYQTNVEIWQLDQNGNKIYGYVLQNAFPKTVGTVELDDSNDSALSEFSVNFAFSEFKPILGPDIQYTQNNNQYYPDYSLSPETYSTNYTLNNTKNSNINSNINSPASQAVNIKPVLIAETLF